MSCVTFLYLWLNLLNQPKTSTKSDNLDQPTNPVSLTKEELRLRHRYFAGDFIDEETVSDDGYGYTKFRGTVERIQETQSGWIISIKSVIDSQTLQFDLNINKDQKFFAWFEFVEDGTSYAERYSETNPDYVVKNLQTNSIVVVQIMTKMPSLLLQKNCDDYCKKVFSDFDSKYDNKYLNSDVKAKTKTRFNIGILSSIGKI